MFFFSLIKAHVLEAIFANSRSLTIGRPCQRCIRKGTQETCRDGIRKQAKYLLDMGSLQQSRMHQGTNNNQLWGSFQNTPVAAASSSSSSVIGYPSMVLPNMMPSPPEMSMAAAAPHQFTASEGAIGATYQMTLPPSPPSLATADVTSADAQFAIDTQHTPTSAPAAQQAGFDFSSRAADFEYSSISKLLGSSAVPCLPGGSTPTTNEFAMPLFTHPVAPSLFEEHGQSYQPQPQQQQQHLRHDSTSSSAGPFGSTPSSSSVDTPPTSEYSPASTYSSTDSLMSTAAKLPATLASPAEVAAVSSLLEMVPPRFTSPEQVYAQVTAPFSYTRGYHSLISYLRGRFDRATLVQLARGMAAFRPSFIATTKTLQEADLVFMEQCFQRTLLEFEKFIAASGTPTVVWRRTGQVVAAGREFCILTGWAHSDLVRHSDDDETDDGEDQDAGNNDEGDGGGGGGGGKQIYQQRKRPRFIVELMDDASVTRYFDLFTSLAFGDSRGVIMTDCTLLTPTGDRVRTACTWTVKRDVFDIPMMIIGNFLPILD